MNRFFSVLLLLPAIAQAQTWTAVAAPTQPLNFVSAGSNYTWSYPFVNPSPAGTYEVSNAIVDKSHRVGAWSQPARITVKSGWQLYGGSWNQPPTSDEAGVAWKIKCINVTETADFKNGSEHYLQTSYEVNSVAPWSGSTPEIQPLYLMWQRFQTVAKLPLGGSSTKSASPPVVVESSFPNTHVELAYCRVTEAGETALSPPVQYTPPILPGMVRAETCQIQFTISEPHPQGTIGYHVYWRPLFQGGEGIRATPPVVFGGTAIPFPPAILTVQIFNIIHDIMPLKIIKRFQNGNDFCNSFFPLFFGLCFSVHSPIVHTTDTPWQRLPAPHCYGEPATPDDWLWQWWDMQPKVIRTVENAPIHKAADKPQSRLCDLQLQLMNRTGNIVVPAGVIYETYCPVIDEWRSEGIFYTFGRQVKAADGGKWQIKKQTSQAGHNRYCVLGIYNQYSTWEGLEGNGAIVFADWSGGQSFGNRFLACQFSDGLLIHPRSAGSSLNLGGHTASELEFTNCTFAGEVPIYIGGVQSANIRFNRTHATSSASDRKGSSVYCECPNQIRFYNGLYTDCNQGGAIFRANGYPANLLVDDIWVDQGFHCFLETAHTTAQVKFRGGKLNCWAHDEHEELTLARLIDSPPALSRLIFEDVQVQFNFVPAIDVISPHYNLCELRFTDTVLAEHVWLREPTKAQEQARANQLYPWGYPAVSTRPVPGLRLSSETSVNSLTNRSKVQRDNWTAETIKP